MTETNAGSVFLDFKAELEGVNRAFQTINAKLDQMGAKGQTAGGQVQKGSAAAAGGFDAMEKASVKAATKIAAATGRILHLQFAIGALMTGPASLGRFGQAITSVGQGLQIFSALSAGATNKLQLLAAGFLGLAVAVLQYVTQAIEAATKGNDRMTEATNKAQRSIDNLKTSLDDAKQAGQAFGQTFGERVGQEFEIARGEFDRILKRLRDLKAERIALRAEQGGDTSSADGQRLQGVINALDFEEERLRKTMEDIRKNGLGLKAVAEVGKTVDETNKLVDALDNVQAHGKTAIALGLSTPLQAAQDHLKAAEAVMQQLIKAELQIRELMRTPGLTPEQRNAIASRAPGAEDKAIAQQDLEKARRELVAAEAPQKFAETFATPFAQGIADGLVQGIQQGASAMETLSKVGENLFSNMLSNAADNFVSAMSKGFTAIAGAGGDILGNLFTGLAGVAGFFLSGKDKKGSSSFDQVASAVTSTQEVRGIVAGPTSIPIAQVEGNLANAVAPLVGLGQQQVDLLAQIRAILSNGSRSAAAPGATRFPGASLA